MTRPKQYTLWEAYTLTTRLHWRGTKDEEGSIAAFSSSLLILGKDYPVRKIDRKVISRLVEQWKMKGLSNGTVNRRLAALGRVLKTAYQAGMRDEVPPSGLSLKEPAGRTRILSEDEIRKLQLQLPLEYANLMLFLLETGMRVSEALSIEWNQVKAIADGGSVLVNKNKADLPRRVPLTSHAVDMMSRSVAGNRGASRVFWKCNQSTFNHEWALARHAMMLDDDPEFVPHALRHTCASRLVEAGISLPVVQKWLGHRNIKTTMRYVHLKDEQLQEAARKMSSRCESNPTLFKNQEIPL